MASAWDLTTLARGSTSIGPQIQANLAQFIPSYITAASIDVARWCRRSFVVSPYDEIRSPLPGQRFRNDPPRIHLTGSPLIPGSLRLQGGRSTCLVVSNADAATNQRATAQLVTTGERELCLTPIGLQLQRTASAVATTSTILWGRPSSWGFAATAGAGGSLAAGTYLASYSIVSVDGEESAPSAPLSVTVPAPGSGTIAAAFADLPAWASGYNLYLSTAGGDISTMTRQNGGTLVNQPAGLNAGLAFTVSGLAAGSAPVASAPLTLSGLAALIGGLGASWTAAVPSPQVGAFPAADLIAPFVPLGCLANSPVTTPVGGVGAAFDIFLDDLEAVNVDTSAGDVVIGLDSGGWGGWGGGNRARGWPSATMRDAPGGPWNSPVRCRYSAGYPAIPEPIQQAVAALVQQYYNDALISGVYKSQRFGAVGWEYNEQESFPKTVRSLLSRWRVL